ncbi:hypothetical protein SAMN05443247_06016 [Bradyrhizobium erythrophlei]|nr:hypothetical protein SAMN05443247_06016 [Bradyrhizobium erythrophlei]
MQRALPASTGMEPADSRTGPNASTSPKHLYVKNVAARYPSGPTWPVQMRADMAAAYLDYDNTKDLCAAIASGYVPFPGALRHRGRITEPVWYKGVLDTFVAATIMMPGEAS